MLNVLGNVLVLKSKLLTVRREEYTEKRCRLKDQLAEKDL